MAMSKENNVALHEIMNSLKEGHFYGKDCTKAAYPYFAAALYTQTGRNGKDYIGWCHFGSSANKFTLRDLNWIIRVIFETTPANFLHEYIRDNESKIDYMQKSYFMPYAE